MILNIGDSRTIESPTSSDIQRALQSLDPGAEDAFVILERPDDAFLQAGLAAQGGFHIEYKDANGHFEARNERVAMRETIALFQSYAADLPNWKDQFEWEPLLIDEADFENAEEFECFGQYPQRDAHQILSKLQESHIPFQVQFDGIGGGCKVYIFVPRKRFPDMRQIVADLVENG